MGKWRQIKVIILKNQSDTDEIIVRILYSKLHHNGLFSQCQYVKTSKMKITFLIYVCKRFSYFSNVYYNYDNNYGGLKSATDEDNCSVVCTCGVVRAQLLRIMRVVHA